MKKKYIFFSAVCLFAFAGITFTSCSSDDDGEAKVVRATDKGTFTDTRDGNVYRWVRYGNLEWMADNFRLNLNDDVRCWLYGDPNGKRVDVNKYGRLYTYQGALDACPEGWRLPTDEDWRQLEMLLGMSKNDADAYEWRGNIAKSMLTMYGDSTDLNLILAGLYSSHNTGGQAYGYHMGSLGYYWTSTVDSVKGAGFYFYRRFIYNRTSVYRQSTDGDNFFSVRYVRDAE